MSENTNLKEIIQNFINTLNTANKQHNLTVMNEAAAALTDESAPTKDFEVVQKYFDAPLASQEDANMKKIAMASTLLAKQNNALPEEMKDYSDNKLYGVVDVALNQAKVAYQYQRGQFEDEDEAFEVLLDTTTARLKTFIDATTQKLQQVADVAAENYLPTLINKLMDAVDSAYPQATVVTKYVRTFAPAITQRVKPLVRQGLAYLGSFAKQGLDYLKNSAMTAKKHVFNFLNN